MFGKTRNHNAVEAWIVSTEKKIISPFFANIVGLLGLFFTIVFAIKQDWKLAVACIIPSLGFIVAAWFVRFYSRQTSRYYESQLANEQKEFNRQLQHHLDAAEALHKFVHKARNKVSEFKERTKQLIEHTSQNKSGESTDFGWFKGELLQTRDSFFCELLEDMVRVFSPFLPPGSRPWAAIREISKNKEYVTRMRAGSVNHDRKLKSQGVREDEGLPRYLREQHEIGEGIVILGKERSPDIWKPMVNDTRGDDTSTMVGPIFLKSRVPYEMPMILYLNSPSEGVFNGKLKPYMRVCTDTLSMLVNMMPLLIQQDSHG